MSDHKQIKNLQNLVKEQESKIVQLTERLFAQEHLVNLGTNTMGLLHEVKNPLIIINSTASIIDAKIKKANLDDELRKTITDKMFSIEKSVSRVNKIIETIFKQSQQRTEEEKSLIDLESLINEYLGYVLSVTKTKYNLHLALETKFVLMDEIEAYPSSLGRVIINLVENAVFAMHEKSLEKKYNPKLEVSTCLDGDYVLIEVRDNGKGVKPEHISRLFDCFFTTKPVGVGTGIGLNMVEKIIKLHQGTISVESDEGAKTTFKMRLPLKQRG